MRSSLPHVGPVKEGRSPGMDFRKKTLCLFLIYFVLLNGVGALNVLSSEHRWGLSANIVFNLLLDTVFLHWCFSARRRFPQKQMRLHITLFVGAFIALNMLKVAKYDFTEHDGDVQRWLWYAYYITFVFGPLFMFHASLYFGKPDNYRISRRWYWMYLPAGIIALGVLTNDWHQLAFRFNSGIADWNNDYTHGVFYHLAALWMLAMLLGVIVLVVRSAVRRRLLKTAWLPLAALALAALYRMEYSFLPDGAKILQSIYEFPDFVCLGSILVWECFVIARIIPSNNSYPAIFAASSLNAGLADGDFLVRQTSANAVAPSAEQLRSASENDLPLPDGDTLLKAHAVQGGWFYWTEDIRELRRLKEQLADTADYIAEENAMLRMSAEIEEERKKTAEQNKLYDEVADALHPQIEALLDLTKNTPKEEAAFRFTMQKAALLVAYTKRRSNLLLLADAMPYFSGEELGLCLKESARVLRLAGKPCEISVSSGIQITPRTADALYETFESALERTLPSLKSVSVALLKQDADRLLFRIRTESGTAPLTAEALHALQKGFDAAEMRCGDSDACIQITINNDICEGGGKND